jgi:dinuclear metal center YbgI/SA1388 family protein
MSVTGPELDAYFRSFLQIEAMARIDDSLNGIQVDNDGSPVTKVAFAVDACMESFRRAAEWGAGMIFVHHGIFWGRPIAVRKGHRTRLSFLLENNLALYAAHLPLDMHPVYGNNAALAEALGLKNVEPFGEYHGVKIGFKGIIDPPIPFDRAVELVTAAGHKPSSVLPFGPDPVASAAVVSGGGAMDVTQAIDEGLDLYVTGESSHSIYHYCLENRIGLIAAGHYQTEIWGVKRIAEKLRSETGIETRFIDLPTGL